MGKLTPGEHIERGWSVSIVLVVALFLTSVHCVAGDWTITPRVSLREVYTDNVRLSSEGNEQHDFITDVSPAVQVRGTGARLNGSLDYRYQTLYYARGTRGRRSNHQLQAIGTAELVDQSLFIDGRATMSQATVDNTGRLAVDNINVTGNTTNVQTFAISPYYRHRLGRWVDTVTRLRYNQVSTDGANSDSSALGGSFVVSSGSAFPRTPWSISYSTEKVDRRDGGADSEFASVNGSLQYRLNRKFALTSNVGYSDNDFLSSQSSTGGASWQVGGNWTPSVRTSLGAAYGQQFSGSNVSFDLSHRWRRSVISSSFSQSITTTRQRLLEQELVPLEDEFGEPIVDPADPSEQFLIPIDTETLTDETQVRSAFQLRYAYSGRRTNASVRQFFTLREFQLSGDEQTTYGAAASVGRKLSSRASVRLSGNWQTSDAGENDSINWGMSARLSYKVAENTRGSLGYAFTQQESDNGSNDSKQNRLTASLQMTF